MHRWLGLAIAAALLTAGGCVTLVRQTDREVERLIAARQRAALGRATPARIHQPEALPQPARGAYDSAPQPTTSDLPPGFEIGAEAGDSTTMAEVPPSDPSTTQPMAPPTTTAAALPREQLFTLTQALAYAQEYRRPYQSAKEDLYLAALALTLERHLWTPIFSSNLRTVYGNYGEARGFDQAMRFVADLGVSQRLPYGGEFTAEMISTLIRDVKQTITAAEGSVINLGVRVPLLRGAGHIAREQLIQLERELTYSVRTFERFRRSQLVQVAQAYFDLVRQKQQVIDNGISLERAVNDAERAEEFERAERGSPLETQRAKLRMLSQQNALRFAEEGFRSQADRFKLLIGMPVEQRLDMALLEDIETIEEQAKLGAYPLLVPPVAATEEVLATQVALVRRLELLTAADRIDDERRGVAISKNALLPDLNWTGQVSFDTDPEHYRLGAFHFERANWRTEVVLSLPLERKAEQTQLRRALISVRQAERNEVETAERVRVEVRAAVNQLRLQDALLRIQFENVQIADRQAQYARLQYDDGELDNRDLIEAEDARLNALNALNRAKTDRWGAILEFRLATETLDVDESGVQMVTED
ncbi:MAG: TolC family protein [Phycisphaerales bacterium]|nr:TolC family protein [Phycisphaerales bacterium]